MSIELAGRDRAADQRAVAKMYVNGYWEDGGYGFPILHNKRPFGNSDWYCDILDKLGVSKAKYDSYTEQEVEYAKELMNGVPKFLQELLNPVESTNDCPHETTYEAHQTVTLCQDCGEEMGSEPGL